MLKSGRIAIFAAAVLLAISLTMAFAQTPTPPAAKTGYAPVNGLNLYYEIHGKGEPLVLLHGGVVGITIFGANVVDSYGGPVTPGVREKA